MENGNNKTEDNFDHEQNLIITEDGSSVLFAGCAHKGIVNIVNHARGMKQMDYVIGGFHLFNPNTKMSESSDLIEQIGIRLKKTVANYYTCHCTGLAPYEQLKKVMGDKIAYLATGSIINIKEKLK